MTEETLNGLDINDLFDLMVKSVHELLTMSKNRENKLAIHTKQKEVELIQRVFLIRRGEFPGG